MSDVPCGGCTACCKNDFVPLRPGDPVHLYQIEGTRVGDRLIGPRLARKPNGDCFYLTPEGCSIYAIRPQRCKEFDCREWLKNTSRQERKRFERDNPATIKVFSRARELLAREVC